MVVPSLRSVEHADGTLARHDDRIRSSLQGPDFRGHILGWIPAHLSVIGCGYLGAVHAACMAKLGHEVIGIDWDEAKVSNLSAGIAPFFERRLPKLLAEAPGTG